MLQLSVENAILQQLISDYKQIVYQFRLNLQIPVIAFTDLESVWGRWSPEKRLIEIRRDLVYQHSWDTVLYVLKHEMAHQIISEVFHLPDSDHGENFQKACDLLALPLEFRKGSGALSESSSWKTESRKKDIIVTVMERIQKLMALAESTNAAEAEVALTRAQELIRKYNLQESSVVAKEKDDFRYIQWDTNKQRLSPVYSHLAHLLMNHYTVDVIFTSTYHPQTQKTSQCLEIYGRETHVLVAEYVLHFLIRVLEDLWRTHKKQTGKDNAFKKSYQLGILAGFAQKLENESQIVEKSPDSIAALVAQEDRARHKFIQQRFPRLRSRASGRSSIDRTTYNSGIEKGRNMQIHQAIKNDSGRVLFLKGARS